MTEEQIKNFWTKVKIGGPDECWEWTGSRRLNNYGQFNLDGKLKSTHRVSWELTNGTIPKEKWVLHKCDNRPCVNPHHLWLGTRRENIDDMMKKNRQSRKITNGKLSKKDREQIKILYWTNGLTQRRIADVFNIAHSAIANVLSGLTYKNDAR